MFGKKQLATLVAEFIGSGVLTLVVIGVQHSTIGVPYFVGVAAALAAAMLVLVFGAASGAVFNPAITIALWSVRRLKTTAAVGYLVAQLLGAWGAYYLFSYHINTALASTGGDFDARIMVAEAVGAAVLAFGWAAAAYGKFTPGLKASVIGLGYALGIVVASSASIGLINPGIALADRAWEIWGSMGWGTYVLGPVLGALVGFNLFAWLFTDEMSLKKLGLNVGSATVKTSASKPVAKKAPAKKKTAAKRK
ncbi:MIP/aquaporin family protein [soil metagenome]